MEDFFQSLFGSLIPTGGDSAAPPAQDTQSILFQNGLGSLWQDQYKWAETRQDLVRMGGPDTAAMPDRAPSFTPTYARQATVARSVPVTPVERGPIPDAATPPSEPTPPPPPAFSPDLIDVPGTYPLRGSSQRGGMDGYGTTDPSRVPEAVDLSAERIGIERKGWGNMIPKEGMTIPTSLTTTPSVPPNLEAVKAPEPPPANQIVQRVVKTMSVPPPPGATMPEPAVVKPPPMDPNKAAQLIVNAEARRDITGKIAVYNLPSGDTGGTYEVAGVNNRYHPEKAAELAALVKSGKAAEAEAAAKLYVLEVTDPAAKPFENPGVNYLVRDIAFNRGNGGAASVVRMALGAEASKGPLTPLEVVAAKNAEREDPDGFITKLTAARETYEKEAYGDRPQFAKGLRNRWEKSATAARDMAGVTPTVDPDAIKILDPPENIRFHDGWGFQRSEPVKALVFHHTEGATNLSGNVAWGNQTGTGTNYYIDPDGNVTKMADHKRGTWHMRPGDEFSGSVRPDLSSRNTLGIEIMTSKGGEPNQKQIAAAEALAKKLGTEFGIDITSDVYGHGEINPGHRKASEGMDVVNRLRRPK